MEIGKAHKKLIELRQQLKDNPKDWTAKHLIGSYEDEIRIELEKTKSNKFQPIESLYANKDLGLQ
jgi:hypothetical protein